MKQFIRVMKALSDPNRVKIIKMLQSKQMCVCEITAVLGLAQSTVSKHLKILEDAELVDSYRDGAWVNYTLMNDFENQYAAVMQKQLKEWLDDAPQIKQVVEQAHTADRKQVCSV